MQALEQGEQKPLTLSVRKPLVNVVSEAASTLPDTQAGGQAGNVGTLRKQMLLRLCSRLLRMLLTWSRTSTTHRARV